MIAEQARFQPQSIPTDNKQDFIIAGPNIHQWQAGEINFNHSPGLMTPMERSEGPFPLQGNIGQLITQETQRYAHCQGPDNIGGARNCTTAFRGDAYTLQNTCGANCVLKMPEAVGMKDFGFPENDPNKFTNAHGIHAFQNVRAGSAGESSQSGCYEDIPNLGPTQYGTCNVKYNPTYNQVGDWTTLPQNQALLNAKF